MVGTMQFEDQGYGQVGQLNAVSQFNSVSLRLLSLVRCTLNVQ
jgi:hypothetical protein